MESSDPTSNLDQPSHSANSGADDGLSDLSFEDLLAAARAGSAEAGGELVARYRAYLLKIAGGRIDPELRQKMGASDVVQETMLTAYQILDHFHGNSEAEWKAWLKTIVGHDVEDLRRRFRGAAKRDIRRETGPPDPQNSGPAIELQRPGPGPRTHAAMNEDSLRLNAALDKLPEEYSLVIRLRNWEQLSYDEIGQRIGKSADAVRKLWTRAIKSLQEEIGGNE